MLSAAIQLVLVSAAVLACLAVIVWGISADHAQNPPAPTDSFLVVGGRRFHQVPVGNTRRLRGRHRAG
ncbi:hypothetical protein [Nocardia yamanashiensis]|uniref:hypothetical protein n=1 Tax=Nocardia yamanashiensis TaxID=209247 RepID=UPI000ACF67D8|nr:hypothetical protein [Nocardia yamanashiensis]